MTTKRAGVLFGLLLVLLAASEVLPSRPTYAQNPSDVTIPKSYGTFKGANMGALVFEDSSGTIRIVDENGRLIATYRRQ